MYRRSNFLNLRLGLYRDAEKQLKSALRDEHIVDTYLYLCKVYVKLDQPLTAIEVYLKVYYTFLYAHILRFCQESSIN